MFTRQNYLIFKVIFIILIFSLSGCGNDDETDEPGQKFWGAPVLVGSYTGNERNIKIACKDFGNAIAVWDHEYNGNRILYAGIYSAASGWLDKAELSNTSGNSYYPKTVITGNGNAKVIWYESDDIYEAVYSPGNGWFSNKRIIDNNDNIIDTPQICINNIGDIFAVWSQVNGFINSARYTSSAGWISSLVEIQGTLRYPQVIIDEYGHALAVWIINGSYVSANRYTPGWGWSISKIAANLNGQPERLRIRGNSNGNAVIVWVQNIAIENHVIYACSFKESAGFGIAEKIEDNIGNVYELEMAKNNAGNSIAVWGQVDITPNGPEYNLYTSILEPDTGWSTPGLIEYSSEPAEYSQVVMDNKGNAIAVWAQSQSDGPGYSIYSNKYEPGTGWDIPEVIEDLTGSAEFPHLVMDSNGNPVVVWIQDYGSEYSVYVNYYR